jgi:CHASE2 domain-containing sensor protein
MVGAVVLACAVGLVSHRGGWLSWLEGTSVDARFAIRGSQRPPRDVVVVGVDNTSLGRLPQYPFPRRLAARAITNLHAAGARVIAYDVGFDRPTDTTDDLSLYDAARRAAPVVFGTTLITQSGGTEVLGGNANLRAIGARAGAADFPLDADGVIRQPLAEDHGLPSFAVAVASDLRVRAPPERVIDGAFIDFHGPSGSIPTIPFWMIVANTFDPAAVRGKVVVVGLTAPILHDVHTTSAGGGPMPGPDVQAEAISTAIRGYPLRGAALTATTLIIVGLALLVPLLDILFGGVTAAIAAPVAFLAWTAAAQVAFDSGTVVDYASATAALLVSTGGVIAIEAISDSRERRRLRSLFAANEPGVVASVLKGHDGRGAIGPTGIIAGYRIDQKIGEGGMGVVYRATQLALDRTVAIKLISAEKNGDPVFRERFKRESRLAASIEHPHVVPVFEAGEDDGLLFIAMRYVDGIDLGCYLRRCGPLPLALAARLIAQLASALDAAHVLGLVHRDVKPANVLLTPDDQPHAYLTDFGVARHLATATRLTRPDALVGTIDYVAPEQIRGEAIDGRADVYSLCAVLYHCLTGDAPFVRENDAARLWAHLDAAPPQPSLVSATLPPELDAIIARGLAKAPTDRYAHAGDLAHAVGRVAGHEQRAGRHELIPSTPPDPRAAADRPSEGHVAAAAARTRHAEGPGPLGETRAS